MEEMKFDQEEMRRLAGRYFAGEIAAEEERELFRFVTSDAACRRQFAAWRLEWEAMPASDAATDRDWRRLRSRIRLQGSARSARPGRFAAVWRAAAAVAVVCATFFGARLYDRLLLERATERYTVTTKSGDRSTVCLPDGTQVRLNGSSTLTYPANFNATNRSVELSGAAYFDVSPDEKHRFEVKVGNCSVVVKGTKFDVTAYPDDSLITTTLLEGAVGFTAPRGETLLRPGESLTYDRFAETTAITPTVIHLYPPFPVLTRWRYSTRFRDSTMFSSPRAIILAVQGAVVSIKTAALNTMPAFSLSAAQI